jgi:hypothetical protein
MYPSFSEQTFKPRRRRNTRNHTPRRQARDLNFFSQHPGRSFFVRACDDAEVFDLLRDKRSPPGGRNFGNTATDPDGWPRSWVVVSWARRSLGEIHRVYVADGCYPWGNEHVKALRRQLPYDYSACNFDLALATDQQCRELFRAEIASAEGSDFHDVRPLPTCNIDGGRA